MPRRIAASRPQGYVSWQRMRDRCHNPNCKSWPNYGGRGIRVCPQWGSFATFIHDVGAPPFHGATLDRIDTNGNYTPRNVRWATRHSQSNNKRNNVRATLRGRTQTLAEWALELELPYTTLRWRLVNNQPLDQDRTSCRGKKI